MPETFTISPESAGERADKALARLMPETSRARVQEAFALGKVVSRGVPVKKSQRLRGGEEITIDLPAPPPSEVVPVSVVVEVLFEDRDVLVINKAAGVIVHPGSGTGEDTVAHFALHHTRGKLSPLGGARRPGIVHRLDKDTSGALALAKSDRAYLALTKAFAERGVEKEYLALVQGVPELRSGSILEPIARHPAVRVKMAVATGGRGKTAHTDWAVEEVFGKRAALVRCWLHTGRTHQIRVHLAHLGHPLLGDRTYGWRPRADGAAAPTRVMLHAEKLAFAHPATGRRVEIHSPPPEDFSSLLAQLREETRRDAKTKIVP